MITTKYNLFKQFADGKLDLDLNPIKMAHDEKYLMLIDSRMFWRSMGMEEDGPLVYHRPEDFFIVWTPFTETFLFNSHYAIEIELLISSAIGEYEETHSNFDFDRYLWALLFFSNFFVIRSIDLNPKIEIVTKLSKCYTNDINERDIPIDYYINQDVWQEVWYA